MREYDDGFEGKIYPCYSIRVNRSAGDLELCKNERCYYRVKIADMPPELDIDNVEHFALMIKSLKQYGLEEFIKCFGLEAKSE